MVTYRTAVRLCGTLLDIPVATELLNTLLHNLKKLDEEQQALCYQFFEGRFTFLVRNMLEGGRAR